MNDTVMTTYNRLPVTFSRGEGIWLEADNGRRYLDALSGIAVCGLGHAHPNITKTISEQSTRLLHTSNLYGIEAQTKLADRLTTISGMDRAFFCNSGAEANECAIKIARRVGHQRGIKSPGIIVMEGAFHGRTLATLTATANVTAKQGFDPLPEGFHRVPFDEPEAIQALSGNPDIIAVLVEPIQGEGGINIPSPDYLQRLRDICDTNNWLLMLDEIQTGAGRTGHWFACTGAGVQPDVITSAKGLGNGLPIGACLARGDAASVLVPGSHGTTFGGNPLCCATALAVLDTLEQDKLLENASETGHYLLNLFKKELIEIPGVSDIRGAGLLLAIELDYPCAELVQQALDNNLLINVTAGNVIRLLPPLIITMNDADQIAEILIPLIKEFLSNAPKQP